MKKPVAIEAAAAAPVTTPSLYPAPFAALTAQRTRRRLGDLFGLSNFGVNLTTIAPGGISALRHAHLRQDEFIYVVSGHPTLHTDAGMEQLAPGMCAGFKAGTGDAHRLFNETDTEVTYLEIGDRSAGDEAVYPDEDLKAVQIEGEWRFFHKDGTPY